MFYHLQYIHLFRPFLKYAPAASPLPSHVSPRRICTTNAGAISKLMRLYKKAYNLRQICNIAVYMLHSACTIHMLNLPEKTAKRDIIHGVKQLEEIAEDWLCARRTLSIISVLGRKWSVEMPEEASIVLQRTDEKFGTFSTSDVPSPHRSAVGITQSPPGLPTSPASSIHQDQQQYSPANPYNQPTPPHVSPDIRTAASMSPELLNGMGMMSTPPPPPPTSMPVQMADPRAHPVNGNVAAMSMNGALPGVNQWTMAPTQQPMTSFSPGYMPVQGGMNSNPPSQTGTPNSLFAIDGPEWFLKDGVSWQQNFETWNLGQPSGNPGGAVPADTNMYMFRGLQGPDMDGTFDSMNRSVSSLDGISGLD